MGREIREEEEKMETVPLSSSSDRPSLSPISTSSPSSPDLVTNHDVSRKYDVFLNFRGEDIRRTLLGHLRLALSEKGIETFIDDDQMESGQFISPQLLQAIESSRCSVVILSPKYAHSTWCLDELVKILDCMKTKGQIVIPIFYHVEPSEVRKQTGGFRKAIAEHEMKSSGNLERVNSWKIALKEVASLVGLDVENYRDEAKFVREIVEEVSRKLTKASSSILEDQKLVETRYPLLGSLLHSCASTCSVMAKFIVVFLVFFLVVAPLFVLFCSKVLEPIFDYIIGEDDEMTL